MLKVKIFNSSNSVVLEIEVLNVGQCFQIFYPCESLPIKSCYFCFQEFLCDIIRTARLLPLLFTQTKYSNALKCHLLLGWEYKRRCLCLLLPFLLPFTLACAKACFPM